MKNFTVKNILLTFLLYCVFFAWNINVQAEQPNAKVSELFEASYTSESYYNYTLALDSVLKILKIDPTNYTATFRTAYLYSMLADYSSSIEYYKKAINLYPKKAIEARIGLLEIYLILKQWENAEKTAMDVIKIDAMNYAANSKMSFILFSTGRYSKAIEYYDKMLDLFPSNLEMKLGIAWSYTKMGKFEEGKKYFQDVVTISPSNANALSGLQYIGKGK
ncbi:MAG: tetratricopeptide repeat protein [Desulfobacterales bacterium]|nr:tetratricopeptide repeat protein [Desulfobacterales bacterium]